MRKRKLDGSASPRAADCVPSRIQHWVFEGFTLLDTDRRSFGILSHVLRSRPRTHPTSIPLPCQLRPYPSFNRNLTTTGSIEGHYPTLNRVCVLRSRAIR